MDSETNKYQKSDGKWVSNSVEVKIQLLDYTYLVEQGRNIGMFKSVRGKMPEKKTSMAMAFDIYSGEDAILPPPTVLQDRYYAPPVIKLRSGFKIDIPEGYGAHFRLRSGFGSRGVLYVGSALIDADYRGECIMPLVNISLEAINISKHERICQMLILPVPNVSLRQVDELSDTVRGEGGFGHTGKF